MGNESGGAELAEVAVVAGSGRGPDEDVAGPGLFDRDGDRPVVTGRACGVSALPLIPTGRKMGRRCGARRPPRRRASWIVATPNSPSASTILMSVRGVFLTTTATGPPGSRCVRRGARGARRHALVALHGVSFQSQPSPGVRRRPFGRRGAKRPSRFVGMAPRRRPTRRWRTGSGPSRGTSRRRSRGPRRAEPARWRRAAH